MSCMKTLCSGLWLLLGLCFILCFMSWCDTTGLMLIDVLLLHHGAKYWPNYFWLKTKTKTKKLLYSKSRGLKLFEVSLLNGAALTWVRLISSPVASDMIYKVQTDCKRFLLLSNTQCLPHTEVSVQSKLRLLFLCWFTIIKALNFSFQGFGWRRSVGRWYLIKPKPFYKRTHKVWYHWPPNGSFIWVVSAKQKHKERMRAVTSWRNANCQNRRIGEQKKKTK